MTKSRPTLDQLRAQVAIGPPHAPALLAALKADPRKAAQALYARCLRHTKAAAKEAARIAEMWAFENAAREQGFSRIAGVDEAGRGPLAGPIVAGAAILASPIPGLDDSKRLTAPQREALYQELLAGDHATGIAIIEAAEIDQHGIQPANYSVMARALAQIDPAPDYALIDGFKIPGIVQPQLRVIKGDRRSQSIAAASILAKVRRDSIMEALDAQYPQYGFARHKGYGTREHLDAIARYGPCPEHRMTFAPLSRQTETGKLFET